MSRKKNVTIEDIARHANVSISTVSRTLRKSSGVTPNKREAVLQAVIELDYRPNVFAQSLASGQSMTLGVLTQNLGSPFYDGILQGILLGLDGSEYSPIFADGRWQTAVEQKALQMLLDRRVDGLILIGGQIPEEQLATLVQQTPLVVVARELTMLPNNCLCVDNFTAAYEATRYLINQGHREIAHITAKLHYQEIVTDVRLRYEGYVQALQDSGIGLDPQLVVEGNLLQQSGVLAIETLLLRGRSFSAIFTANDQMAFGARLGLYRRGIRVPDDVSLVGFDNEASAAYFIPPLTTVRQPAVEMGQAAAQVILDCLNEKPVQLPTFRGELIIRETVTRQG